MSERHERRWPVYQGTGIELHRFRCDPCSVMWRRTNIIRDWEIVVFPWVGVEIRQEGFDPVIATPNTATIYGAGSAYTRCQLDPVGDVASFIVIDRPLLREMIAGFDPDGASRERALIPFDRAPLDSDVFYRQYTLVRMLERGEVVDPIALDETLYGLAERVLRRGYERLGTRRPGRTDTRAAHAEAAREACRFMTRHWNEPLGLEGIAAHVHCSAYHFARLFKRETGMSVHAYLSKLRLCVGLTRVADAGGRLTALALELGYSSHSHFTTAFRKEFGVTPSEAASVNADEQFRESRGARADVA